MHPKLNPEATMVLKSFLSALETTFLANTWPQLAWDCGKPGLVQCYEKMKNGVLLFRYTRRYPRGERRLQ